MKYLYTLFLFLLIGHYSYGQSKKVVFKTIYGDIKVVLYDYTPKHRDLLIDAINDSVYRDALFNRIIKDFVVQGGEHDHDIEIREKELPEALKQRLAPEFDARAFHKLGSLGAGRDDNPQKASFLNQLYFVVGKPVTSDDLDQLTSKKNIVFTQEQRDTYLKNGGLPRLDNDYTVFGEVYEGLEVIMKISQLPTDKMNYPLQPVAFQIVQIKD